MIRIRQNNSHFSLLSGAPNQFLYILGNNFQFVSLSSQYSSFFPSTEKTRRKEKITLFSFDSFCSVQGLLGRILGVDPRSCNCSKVTYHGAIHSFQKNMYQIPECGDFTVDRRSLHCWKTLRQWLLNETSNINFP